MSITNEIITSRIKYLRKLKGITQIEMAEAMGISKSAYNRIEMGEVSIYNDRLNLIIKILDISLFELIFFFETVNNEIIEQIDTKKIDLTVLQKLIAEQIEHNKKVLEIINKKMAISEQKSY